VELTVCLREAASAKAGATPNYQALTMPVGPMVTIPAVKSPVSASC